MKLISFFKTLYRSPKYEKLRLLVVSFVLACISWVYVTARISTSMQVEFKNVPVIMDGIKGTKAESYGLTVMLDEESEIPKTSVVIHGKRTAIGGLTKSSDIEAYVDYNSAIDRVGLQSLPIKIRRLDGTTITDCTLTLKEVSVDLDRYQTMTINAKVDASNLESLEDVQIDHENISCEPSTMTVWGPSKELARIDHVRVKINNVSKIEKNQVFDDTSFELVSVDGNLLTDADGKPLSDKLTLQNAKFTARVPVFYLKTLPATVDVTGSNIPQNLDMETLRKRLRLIVADDAYLLPEFGKNTFPVELRTDDSEQKAILDGRAYQSIGQVALSSLTCDGAKIPITRNESNEGFEILTDLENAYVALADTEGLVTQERRVKAIYTTNAPSNFDFQVQTKEIVVTLVGDAEQVNAISAEDISASVNLGNEKITEAKTFQKTVSITLPHEVDMVWVYGTPKVTVTATEKKTTTP